LKARLVIDKNGDVIGLSYEEIKNFRRRKKKIRLIKRKLNEDK
jgi:hypothetical protein